MRCFPVVFSLVLCCLSLFCVAETTDFSTLRAQLKQARAQGDLAKADQLASDYLRLATVVQDPLHLGMAHFQLGKNAMERNNYRIAKPELEQAVALLQPLGNSEALADALDRLGMTYRYQSDYANALKYLYQAMQIYRDLEDLESIASGYNNIGTVLEKMGQFEEALHAHQQSLELSYQLKDSDSIASTIFNLADLHRSLGDNDQALKYFLQTLEMDMASGNQRDIAYSHNKLGFLYSDLKDFDKARTHADQALTLFQQIGAKRDIEWARTVQAKLAMEQGDFAKAQQLLDQVIETAIAQSYKSLLVDSYKMAAELSLRQGKAEAALSYIEPGIVQAQQNNERADEALLQQMRVDAYIRLDQVRDALHALQAQKQLEDEIFSNKKAATIAAIQAQTEYTRQQYQISLLQNEQSLQQVRLEQSQLARNFWIFGLMAVFVLMISLYRRYQQNQQNRRLEQEVAARTSELEQKNTELQQAYQQLEVISLTDKLTGLYNRHFLESHIETELEQCRRRWQDWQSGKTSQPERAELAVFLIDLDHFKALNDNYGHYAGDEVLQHFSQKLQQVFRQSDYLVRWGGEEFVVIARSINREEAAPLAQRLVDTVQQELFPLSEAPPVAVSCSVGYACYPLPLGASPLHWESLLKLADLCLYAAKYSGRSGWVGLEAIKAETDLLPGVIAPGQLQLWHGEGQLQVQHSFARLNWLG